MDAVNVDKLTHIDNASLTAQLTDESTFTQNGQPHSLSGDRQTDIVPYGPSSQKTGFTREARQYPSRIGARARAEARRVQVAKCIALGMTEVEIAREVGAAPST